MANWCYNVINFFQGDDGNDRLATLYNDLQIYSDVAGVEGAAKNWIGHLLTAKGLSISDSRGFILDYELYDDYLMLNIETAWSPLREVYSEIAEAYDLNYVFIAEEESCGVFINTDRDGRFFEDRYYVPSTDDIDADEEKLPELLKFFEDCWYREDLESLLKDFEQIGVIATSFEELSAKLAEMGINVYEYKSA